jgi:hypothetical protein
MAAILRINGRLLAIDAREAASKVPHEWSLRSDKFAQRPPHMKGAEPVGPNGVVGPSGGDPRAEGHLGVIGPALEPAKS